MSGERTRRCFATGADQRGRAGGANGCQAWRAPFLAIDVGGFGAGASFCFLSASRLDLSGTIFRLRLQAERLSVIESGLCLNVNR